MGYTLEQLQKMGATPVAPKRGYTSDELKKLGAKPLNFQETPEPKETTWGTIKSIAKELPGAMKTVATAPFKNPIKTTQAVVAGAGDVGVGVANLGLKLSGSKTRLPSLTKAFAESQTNEKDQDLYTALGEGSKMYSSFALGQKSVDKFVKNPVARGVLGNVVGGQATMDADATAKERGTQSLFDAAFGVVTEGVGPLARKVFKKQITSEQALVDATKRNPYRVPEAGDKPGIFSKEYADLQGYEPIVPDDALPVIKAGKTPKEKVVKYGKDNPKVFDDGITASDGQPPIPTKTSLQDKGGLEAPSVESPLISETKKYKSAEEFVKAAPKTVKVWNKSKFSNDGAYADIPVTKKVDNVTLYQGGKTGDGRQFWTSDKKYASQFGEVKEKTGSFYKVDNGNRVTDVYVEAPTKSQLTDIWKKANKKAVELPKATSLEQEAKKYKSAEEFVKAQGTLVYHGGDKIFKSSDEIKFGDDVFYTLKRTDKELKELAESASPDNYWSYDDLAKMPANAFGKDVSEFVVKFKNPKIVDAKGKGWMDLTDGSISDWTNKIVRQAQKDGKKYDGIVIKNIEEGFSGKGTLGANAGLVDDYIVLDKSAIKTKSQLTDIWNKANKKVAVELPTGLVQQAKKYKSAEEFATSNSHIFDRSGELVRVGDNVDFSYGGSEFKGKLVKVNNFDGSYETTSAKGKEFRDYSPEVTVEATENIYNKGGFLVHKKGDKFKVNAINLNEYKENYSPVKTKSQLEEIWNKANNGPTYAPAMKKTFDETIVEKANPQFIKEVEDTTERVFKDMPDYNGTTQVRQTAAYKDLMDQGKEDYVLDVASKRIKDPNLNEGAAYKLLEDHYKTTKQYEKILELGKTARPLNEAGQTLSMGNMGDGADGPAIMIGKAIEAKRTALAKRGINVDKEISSYFDESLSRLKKGEAWDNISDDLINFLTCK